MIIAILSTCIKFNNYGYYVSFSAFMLSLIYAVWNIIPIRNISLLLRNNIKINIQVGDLFSKKGIIVIPVNTRFDTIADDIIIAKSTLHGQFLQYYKAKYQNRDLDKEIEKSLKNITQVNKVKVMNKEKKNILWELLPKYKMRIIHSF